MASEAFKPITTIQEPSIQGMPRFYTSTREVAAEWEPPVRGSVVGPILGSRFKLHIVLDATVQPSGGKLVATITHCSPTAWAVLLNTVERDGADVFLYKQQVVPTPTQSEAESDYLSTFEPIDESKSLKKTKVPRRRAASDTFEDGYPTKQKKSKGVENLTPQKFKRQTETAVTVTQETLAAVDVNNIPAPSAPTGDETLIEHEKITEHRYERRVTIEEISENDSPLLGEEYGDVVTNTVSELLVADGTAADAGIQIISSTVDPIGNGKSVKTTKSVKGGAWPNPVSSEISKDGSQNPPGRYLRTLTRKTTKKKVASVPSTVTLGAGEIAKSYKQETPDRAEEATVTEDLTLNLSAIDEDVQQKPFVKITSVMTPAETKLLPLTGNGSAKLVWDNGTKQIWENTEEVVVAREGYAGSDLDVKPFVQIQTDKRYSVSNEINTSSGGANIIFNDGTTQIYEVSEITSSGRYGPAGVEQDAKPFVKIVRSKEYASDGNLTSAQEGTSNKIYDDGTTVVYDKTIETALARPGLKGVETNNQQWGSLVSTTNYTTSSTAPAGGSVQLIYKGGGIEMYETTTTAPTTSGSKTDVEPQPWGQIRWDGLYDVTTSGVRSSQVWSNGVEKVFLNENPTLTISGTTKEIDANSWGSITWNGTFDGASGGMRSQKVSQIGEFSVYKNENPVITPATGTFVSSQETHPLYTTVETSSYASTSILGPGDSRSKQVFAMGAERVFENISRVVTGTVNRTYGTMVKFSAPSVLINLGVTNLMRRDGGIDMIANPVIEEGFEGYFPAVITEYYSDNPTAPSTPLINFGPAPIRMSTPFGNVSVGATLHAQIRWPWSLSGDRTYYDSFSNILIPATPYTHWKGAGRILVGYETQPYLNGYIVREIHITL